MKAFLENIFDYYLPNFQNSQQFQNKRQQFDSHAQFAYSV